MRHGGREAARRSVSRLAILKFLPCSLQVVQEPSSVRLDEFNVLSLVRFGPARPRAISKTSHDWVNLDYDAILPLSIYAAHVDNLDVYLFTASDRRFSFKSPRRCTRRCEVSLYNVRGEGGSSSGTCAGSGVGARAGAGAGCRSRACSRGGSRSGKGSTRTVGRRVLGWRSLAP